jgi:hypothetical protein
MEVLIVSTIITFLLYGGLLAAARFKRSDSDEMQRIQHVRNMNREKKGRGSKSSEGAEEGSSESKSAFKRFLKEVSKG